MNKAIRVLLFLLGVSFSASAQMYNCSLPLIEDANPVNPSTHINCVLPATAVPVASDGDVIFVFKVAAPVHFIYCAKNNSGVVICNTPFMFNGTDLEGIGPWKRFGGPPIPGQLSFGTLYLIPGAREVIIGIKKKDSQDIVTKVYPAAK